MLCDFDIKQNKYMEGEIVMHLNCISRLSFKNANNTLEDDIKNSPYTSYFLSFTVIYLFVQSLL